MNNDQIEYNMALVAGLELIWGQGFLSPGGPEEVAETLAGRDITGAEVLDIGCGIGGIDLLLAERFGAARVVGIDVEEPNLQLATRRAAEKGLADRVSYRLVEAKPGPLPFPAGSFDVVFSKDAIIHIPDKEAVFADIHRLLRPGSRFIASDWLRADDNPPSPAMERYIAYAQDKYSLQVPDGIAFSDFRGYEDWEVVSVAQTSEVLKVIVANPIMIAAYKSGIPGNGQPFPDGSKIAKIQWIPKKSTEAPFDVNVPDKLKNVFLIEKDSKRFPNTAGWGYALFEYDATAATFSPDGKGSGCGFECHTIVKAKDYIFHPFQNR